MHKNYLKKLLYILSPYYIVKEGIHASLTVIVEKYKMKLKNKNLLDIGCGSQPYRSFFNNYGVKYKGIDFKTYSYSSSTSEYKPDYFFKEKYKRKFTLDEFKSKSFDIITAFEVLEHHKMPEIFFSEASRLLADKGYILITFPFVWNLHGEPFDYQRFTHHKIKYYCEANDLKIIEIVRRGGVFTTLSQVINLSFLQISSKRWVKYFIYTVLLLPIQIVSLSIDRFLIKKNLSFFLGYTILIQKK